MHAEMNNNRDHNNFGMDRRTADRFPISEEIRYRVLDRQGERQDGVGKTLDMSREGVQFTTPDPLAPGRLVELSVNWPARLNGTCRLQFVATGHVIRSTGESAVMRIERYEFKTRRELS